MSYTVRRANKHDIPMVLEATELVISIMQADGNFQWSKSYPTEIDFMKDISNEVLWVAESESGEVHGFSAITFDQGDDYSAVWDISQKAVVPHRLAVHPKAQGKGVAKLLLLKAEELAKESGCLSVINLNLYLLTITL